MVKAKLKKKFYNKDLEYITDKTERFIVFINDFKQAMGAWYSVVALRVIPILLFIIPVNGVLARVNLYIKHHFIPDFYSDGPILMVMWAAAMAILIILVILAPKAATVFELLFGFAYVILAFVNHLYNTPFGIALIICMILYLIVKVFFLIVAIMQKVKFSGDAPNVERDETGRIVRASGEDILFIKSDDREEIDKNRPLATADNDFLFEKTEDVHPDSSARAAFDDDYFFDKIDDKPNKNAKSSYDDDFFFTKGDEDKKNIPVAGSDEDFVF